MNREDPTTRKLMAWGVHGYTGLGLSLAFFSMIALLQASQGDARGAALFFLFNGVAMFVDATDGAMARLARVKEVLPAFDGSTLDNIIDFLTFAFLPALALPLLGILPTDQYWAALMPLLASGYGFCQTKAKTDESFVGFPSYWNLVVFYCYVLGFSTATVIALLAVLSVLVFVPIHYIYPSRTRLLRPLTVVLGGVYYIMYMAVSWSPSAEWAVPVAWASMYFVAYYTVLSLVHHRRIHRAA
ncbi:MAG: hypothetical protein P8R54_06845 [Myxococcota bacterium]|nr:hypothetical protein [Myxococcota bacterium]